MQNFGFQKNDNFSRTKRTIRKKRHLAASSSSSLSLLLLHNREMRFSFFGFRATFTLAGVAATYIARKMLQLASPGTDVMIFQIFSPKISAKKLAFLTRDKAKLCKILIITLIFEKNANFFAENCRK
jgi:hypothetical protein